MTCDCFSYNRRTGTTPETILPRSWFMEGTDRRPNGVPVDACIADTVAALWKRRVVTEGSCCGHGKDSPSLVLGSGENPDAAMRVLAEVDDRPFTLYQWQLTEVGGRE